MDHTPSFKRIPTNNLAYACRVVSNSDETGATPRATLRLVVRVGSLTGRDTTEECFAHFIEHLGFRSTSSHDHAQLIKKMAKHGVKFGADLNAKTTPCATIWQLDSIPLDGLEEALAVLHEWAFEIQFSPEDVEAERRVILQELLHKQGVSTRIKNRFWQTAMPQVKAPIGTADAICNATAPQLQDFYRRTYIPSEMAVVVSIVNAPMTLTLNEVEAKVVAMFSTTTTPVTAATPGPAAQIPQQRQFVDLAGLSTPLLFVPPRFISLYDADLSHSSLSVEFITHEPMTDPRAFFKQDLMKRIASSCLDQHFKDVIRARYSALELGLASAGVSFGVLLTSPPTFHSAIRATCTHQATSSQALKSLLTELFHIYRYGFTQNDIHEACEKWHTYFRTRAAHPHSSGNVDELVDHFLFHEQTPMLSAQQEYQLVEELLNNSQQQPITIQVNEFLHVWLASLFNSDGGVPSSNHTYCVCVVTAQGPDDASSSSSTGRVTDDGDIHELLAHVVSTATVLDGERRVNHQIMETKNEEPLLARILAHVPPLAQPIPTCATPYTRQILTSTRALHTQYAHGTQVCILNSSSSSTTRISFQAFALGGASELSDQADDAAFLLLDAVNEEGIGTVSAQELSRLDSKARVAFQRHLLHRGIGGSCASIEHLELLLAMLLARLESQPRIDLRLFERARDEAKRPHRTDNPETEIARLMRQIAFDGNREVASTQHHDPLLRPVPVEVWDQVTPERVVDVATRAFYRRPWNEFMFVFSGPVTLTSSTSLGLFDKYLGARLGIPHHHQPLLPPFLPVNQRPTRLRVAFNPAHVVGGSPTGRKATMVLVLAASVPEDHHNSMERLATLHALCDLLRDRLIGHLRTTSKNVDTYSVSADVSRASLSHFARIFLTLHTTNDDAIPRIKSTVEQVLADLCASGPAQEETNTLRKRMTGLLEENRRAVNLFGLMDVFKSVALVAKTNNTVITAQDVDALACPVPDIFVNSVLGCIQHVAREIQHAGMGSIVYVHKDEEGEVTGGSAAAL